MASSPLSASTLSASPAETKSALDLSHLPPIFVLPTHLDDEELHRIEEKLLESHASITYDITEARLVIGKVSTKRRAELELRCRRVWTDEVPLQPVVESESSKLRHSPPKKRRRITDSSSQAVEGDSAIGSTTEDEDDRNEKTVHEVSKSSKSPQTPPQTPSSRSRRTGPLALGFPVGFIKVVTVQWIEESVAARKVLPLDKYIVYAGEQKERPKGESTPQHNKGTVAQTVPQIAPAASQRFEPKQESPAAILERAKADAAGSTQPTTWTHKSRKFGTQHVHAEHKAHHTSSKLMQQTTSEYDGSESEMPEEPDWVKADVKYACQRSTPPDPPNQAFIEELKQIRLGRTLTLDEIGVRAYSTSIAAIAAYQYPITSPREILRLPGCDHKIANLWIEWKNTGSIQEAQKTKEDEAFINLNLFYKIWGVGAQTAREFYYERGWQDLDDVIEFGWNSLARVQQIGVKYYDEFLKPMPRSEVESIASVIRSHAIKIRDPGIEVVIVGGYRRGKSESADVDVIVSHRSLEATAGLVTALVLSLEKDQWITHTLIHSEHNSQRGQATLPHRAPGIGGGHGFDSLDKALVVWQDPHWATRASDLAEDPKAKNPNIHRRVDIIISPWRTVGCAILGWSGGTTFQRDLRRYAKNVKGWKFDSSGVRNRATGQVVLLEGPNGVSGSWQDAERTVFEGLGLEYKEAWERCTN